MVYKDCCFLRGYSYCGILNRIPCKKDCKFYKTQEQYEAAREIAEKKLHAKGLYAAMEHVGDQMIITAKRRELDG